MANTNNWNSNNELAKRSSVDEKSPAPPFSQLSYTQQPQQQQYNQQQQMQQFDVRMKRHPELQPYVPSDRDTFLRNTNTRTNNNPSRTTTTTSATNSRSSKPPANSNITKRCVSMNRIDQLAQPKKMFTLNNKVHNDIPKIKQEHRQPHSHQQVREVQRPEIRQVKQELGVKPIKRELQNHKSKSDEEKQPPPPPQQQHQPQLQQDQSQPQSQLEEPQHQSQLDDPQHQSEQYESLLESHPDEPLLESHLDEPQPYLTLDQQQQSQSERDQQVQDVERSEVRQIKLELQAGGDDYEDEIREVARREKEERESRHQLVESILSKIYQSN